MYVSIHNNMHAAARRDASLASLPLVGLRLWDEGEDGQA